METMGAVDHARSCLRVTDQLGGAQGFLSVSFKMSIKAVMHSIHLGVHIQVGSTHSQITSTKTGRQTIYCGQVM